MIFTELFWELEKDMEPDKELNLGVPLAPCEVAQKLRVSIKVVYGLIKREELKAKKIGGHYRIYTKWIKEYLVEKR